MSDAKVAESAFAAANDLMIDEDYAAALESYNCAIEMNAMMGNYYSNRCMCHLKLKDFENALADANKALELGSNLHKVHFRKGQAAFNLDQYREAKASFSRAAELGNKNCSLWLRKCDAELRLMEKEVAKSTPASSITATTATAAPALKSAFVPTPAATQTPTPASVPKPTRTLADKVRVDWMQSSTTITITLFAKNLTADKVVSEFTTDTVKATLIMPDDSIFEKTWKMFGTFDCEGVQKKVNKYKVEFYLKKVPQTQWKAMEAPSSASVAAATPSLNQQQIQERPNQITDRKGLANPYATKKVVDWDALEREAQQEEEEEKPEGEAALNKLFQKIYKDADPEVRRAMMKSYQTSGGTVLSTNWSEVKDKDYEKDIQAPKGQEVRKWNE